MTMFIQLLAITSSNITVSNTTSLSTLFSHTIEGGTLQDHNKIKWEMQGNIGFKGQNEYCTIYSYYGGATVSSVILKNIANTSQKDIGLKLISEVSADNSVNSQCGLAQSFLGLPRSEDGSTPVGFGTIGVDSNGDQDFEIKCQWSSTGVSNSIVNAHSSLELLSYIEELPVSNTDEVTAYIYLNSKLNNLRYNLRKYAYFYAPLEHELDFFGYGDVTFTRSGTSTAVYKDAASHNVAINEPRFEYTGSTVSGLAINTATETLTFSTANSLNDSNSLCWKENDVYKSTVRGNTNPFNGSGVWIGNTGIHITHIVKFNKVITSSEDSEVENALS